MRRPGSWWSGAVERLSANQAGHDPSRHKMYVRLVLSPVAAACHWSLLADPRTSYIEDELSEIAPSRLAAKSGTCCWVGVTHPAGFPEFVRSWCRWRGSLTVS